jgi:hypothetical protein
LVVDTADQSQSRHSSQPQAPAPTETAATTENEVRFRSKILNFKSSREGCGSQPRRSGRNPKQEATFGGFSGKMRFGEVALDIEMSIFRLFHQKMLGT